MCKSYHIFTDLSENRTAYDVCWHRRLGYGFAVMIVALLMLPETKGRSLLNPEAAE
jgi:hypothetical protein